jgi:hypothetical protein
MLFNYSSVLCYLISSRKVRLVQHKHLQTTSPYIEDYLRNYQYHLEHTHTNTKKILKETQEKKNFFFFLQCWGENSGPSSSVTLTTLLLWRVFQDRVSQTLCPDWLWTAILLISATWIARIIGMSHRCPTRKKF